MLKSYRYIPQNFDEVDRVYVSQMNECSCRILKQYIQHWLSDRLGVSNRQYKEFVVPCSNAWDVHPVNTNETENIYRVFAESARGPLIILQKNAVCTQFHVNPKYPETVLLLENFVKRMCEKIYTEKVRMDVPLARVILGGYGKPPMKATSGTSMAAGGHHSVAFNTAKHSGYAFSKRGGPVLVMNNATTANIVKAVHEESDESGSSNESSYSFTMKRSAGRSLERTVSLEKMKAKKMHGVNSDPTLRQRTTMSPVPVGTSDWTTVTWSRQDIREFLHPGYPIDAMPPRPNTQAQARSLPSSTKGSIKYKFTPFHYCRYREFAKAPPSGSQTLRSEGTPFIESARVHLQEAMQNKEKWLIQKGFRAVFRPSTRGDVHLPLSTEPNVPITQHQFREPTKSNWKV